MLKRINWRAIFKGFAWIVCLSGLVVLMGFIEVKKQDVKCENVKIIIPGADNFIEREEIDAILAESEGNLIGRNLKEVNTQKIEKTIQANPYIAFAKVYADMDGVIHIEIKQRQPVLRVINAGGQDYYIDKEGLKMPVSANFTANVLVATGNILEGFGGRVDSLRTPLAADLYQIALYLKKDTLWDAQIEQIFVNNKKDIELIPRVGNQRIILGDASSLDHKMDNLLAFYKQAMPLVGWDAYKTISVKYANQVVCEKNDMAASDTKKPVVPMVIDSNVVAKQAADSMIKAAINAEIEKARSEDEKEKKKAAATKEQKVTVNKAVKTSDPESKASDKTKATVQKKAAGKQNK